MKRTLGIVPARAGSKRLPGKNMRRLGGKPLVARAIETALLAQTLTDVVVSSDSPDVLACADGYPRVRSLLRPTELADDTALAIDYVRHALRELGSYDGVAIIQPTSPFTTAADVDAVVTMLYAADADSVATVMQVDHALHPLKLKLLVGDKLEPFWEAEAGRMAEHELPKLYARNGSVYAAQQRTIERGILVSDDCRAVVMPRDRSIDINDAIDFAFAEFLVARA